MHRGVAAAGVGAEEYGAEQSHRYLRVDGVEVAAAIPRRRGEIWLWHCDSRCARSRGEARGCVGFGVNAGRPPCGAANVDGELEVFARYLRQSREFRLALRFTLQRSELQIESCDWLVVPSRLEFFSHVASKSSSPRVNALQRRSTTYADTYGSKPTLELRGLARKPVRRKYAGA